MDDVKETMGEGNSKQGQDDQSGGQQSSEGGGGILGTISDTMNSATGSGNQGGSSNGGLLAQGIEAVQQYTMGQGAQNNSPSSGGQGGQSEESSLEHAGEAQVSEFIRDQYKSTSGNN